MRHNIQLEAPHDETRIIQVKGMHLPEFDVAELSSSPFPDPYFALGSIKRWVDATLLVNLQQGVDDDGDKEWQTPKELWIPAGRSNAIQIAGEITATNGKVEEDVAYYDDPPEYETVKVVTTTERRSIATIPKKFATSLDYLFLDTSYDVTGNFRYRQDYERISRKVGNATLQRDYRGDYFFNESTQKRTRNDFVIREAQRVMLGVLTSAGYNPKAFETDSITYAEYLAAHGEIEPQE